MSATDDDLYPISAGWDALVAERDELRRELQAAREERDRLAAALDRIAAMRRESRRGLSGLIAARKVAREALKEPRDDGGG